MNADEVLTGLARESAKQGENLRAAVRGLTLNALKGRELTMRGLTRVVPKLEANRMLGEAFAGIDEAVLKTVQANHLALQQLAAQRQSLSESHFQRALDELERLEDDLYARVKEAAKRGGTPQVAARLEEFSDRVHDVVKQQRRTALKAAEAMAENFTALASGILAGLTEGLQQGKRPTE